MRLELNTVSDLEPFVATYCAENLCNKGSEMQSELFARKSDTPIVIASVGVPIGWVASHEWRGQQTLEAFVAVDWRRRSVASMGAQMLAATSYLDRQQPVAVFSGSCVPLAKGLGFRDVLHYTRSGKDWTLHLG